MGPKRTPEGLVFTTHKLTFCTTYGRGQPSQRQETATSGPHTMSKNTPEQQPAGWPSATSAMHGETSQNAAVYSSRLGRLLHILHIAVTAGACFS